MKLIAGRADEHPAVLDAGLVRTHADDRHPHAERGVDVPRRERRSPPSGRRGGLIARSTPGPRDRRAALGRARARHRRALGHDLPAQDGQRHYRSCKCSASLNIVSADGLAILDNDLRRAF